MTRRDVWVLRGFAGWSTFVWVVLIKNMLFNSAHQTVGFRVVHLVLAAVSLTLAGLTFGVARRAAHRLDPAAGTAGSAPDPSADLSPGRSG